MPSLLSLQVNPDNAHRTRRGLWLHLVLGITLLLGSWLLGSHAIGHIGDPADSDCVICLIASGLDHSLAQTFDLQLAIPLQSNSAAGPLPFFCPPAVQVFRCRAPPSFLIA